MYTKLISFIIWLINIFVNVYKQRENEKIRNDSSDIWINDFGVRDERLPSETKPKPELDRPRGDSTSST